MRTLAVALTLAAVLPTFAAAAAGPRAEKVRLRPADVALAKRAVLRPADVGPEWTRVAAPKQNDAQFACGSFRPDFSSFTITGQASASFRSASPLGTAQIDSTVAVFPTRSQAAGDFRRGAKPALAACLADQVRRVFRNYPRSVRGRLLSSKMVTAPDVGELSAAYAVSAELNGNGASMRVFVDLIVVQRGRSLAALVFTALGSRLPSRQYFAASVTGRLP
jgi:hypothetical protein